LSIATEQTASEIFYDFVEFCRLSDSFNAYTQISSRALCQALKENARLNAEKRGVTDLRYQKWENGKGGQQVCPSLVSRMRLPLDKAHTSNVRKTLNVMLT
jgi:F-type H+-transporting ATPase subunit epsilon